METAFLTEKKLIAMCFNPTRDSIFTLVNENEKLELAEEDFSKNLILKRFNIMKQSDMSIINSNYKKLPKDTFEGYFLYYWSLTKKLVFVHPIGYLVIYDYLTTNIIHHFQCTGKLPYIIRNIVCSPIEKSLFLSAEGMRNVYHLHFDNIKPTPKYDKLVLPKDITVNDIMCHPKEKFVFIACSDALIRVYDYSNFQEVQNGLVDVNLNGDGKTVKNQSEVIKKSNIFSSTCIDFNYDGGLLINGNDNGFVYLWDATLAIQGKRYLISKEKLSNFGIICAKFIKTKQFENMNRFLSLSKEGKIFICNLFTIDEQGKKKWMINKLYENSIFNPISQLLSINKYNVSPTYFISCSSNSNTICVKWPVTKNEKIKISPDKTEDYLLFLNYNAKFFFLYDNYYPKINFPLGTQMLYRKYEDYIPITNTSNLNFDQRVFLCDNYFIYYYDIMTGSLKSIVNYSNEFKMKNLIPLKFEVRPKSLNIKTTEMRFLIHIENENFVKSILILIYDLQSKILKKALKIDDIIDFVPLRDPEEQLNEVFLLHKNKQTAIIYKINENQKEQKGIDGTIHRCYWTPLTFHYSVIYRNVLNEIKFSNNLKSSEIYDYKVCNDYSYRLEYSEREIDLNWQKIENDRYLCIIIMVEKIVITDECLLPLYSVKSSLLANLNLVSSVFWMGKTVFYSKGNTIYYFYPFDGIEQKIFTSDQNNILINGLLSDRMIYSSKINNSKEQQNLSIFTPPISILEPLLIGYLDYTSIDYNLVKEAVSCMFTNQFSQNLIEKLIKKDLKEVCWLLINDSKSSFQNLEMKLNILNDLLKFDLTLDLLLPNKNLKDELELDDIIWKINYDQNSEILRNLILNQVNVFMNYGQFDLALKLIELLNDFPKAINLLFLASSKSEYEKVKESLFPKNCLSYSDTVLMNNLFFTNQKEFKEPVYNKIFDNYKGEPFIFGINFDKIQIQSIKDVDKKVNKRNSFINQISNKKLSFGEHAFNQYVNVFNSSTQTFELSNICTLILQKFEQFYGNKNTFYEKAEIQQKKIVDFENARLSDLGNNPYDKIDEAIDNSIDPNMEEFNERGYLSAYFHFDKGMGAKAIDYSDCTAESTISVSNLNENEGVSDEMIWTEILEEFEPIEYEDKWGRKNQGAHAIKFSKSMKTSFNIKHNLFFAHFSRKFTFEFWVKFFSVDVDIMRKDQMCISIQNGTFLLNLNNKIIPPTVLKEYMIECDKWIHLILTYKKKDSKIIIMINCEEVVYFQINLPDDLGKKHDIVLGNGNLEGLITEVRIYNQVIPQKFLYENYKSPLPILAENKKKLNMKINKQDDKKKEFGHENKSFAFKNPGGFAKNNFSKPKISVAQEPSKKFEGFTNPNYQSQKMFQVNKDKVMKENSSFKPNYADINIDSIQIQNDFTENQEVRKENFEFGKNNSNFDFVNKNKKEGENVMDKFPDYISEIQHEKDKDDISVIDGNFNFEDFDGKKN